jgi:hypothetical protein
VDTTTRRRALVVAAMVDAAWMDIIDRLEKLRVIPKMMIEVARLRKRSKGLDEGCSVGWI